MQEAFPGFSILSLSFEISTVDDLQFKHLFLSEGWRKNLLYFDNESEPGSNLE